ncbi:50S ribosomal protein L32e [Candidatus Woesearchaeota archaeon]|nr:50S ribosomal protein L32e [Candidatus Woesearchaeota archaeon]
MMQTNTLLELRNKIKDKKPVFIRQDNPKRMKLNYKWRKPKGIHSKIRHKFKGRRKMPSPGYKSPRKVKGMHSSGLKTINIFSVGDLTKIKKENEGIILSKNVGIKKKYEILKKAKELNVTVLNLNVDGQIKKIEDFISSKKKAEKETKKQEAKKEESKEKKGIKETKEKEHESTHKDKKEYEKKEKDKLLTKKV